MKTKKVKGIEVAHLGAQIPMDFFKRVSEFTKKCRITKTDFVRYAGDFFMEKVSPKNIFEELSKLYDKDS